MVPLPEDGEDHGKPLTDLTPVARVIRNTSPLGGIAVALAAAALSLLAVTVPARARVVHAVAAPAARTALVALVTGKSQVLRTGRPYAQALVGNPEIADVLPMSGAQIYVLGKKPGSTNLTLYDRAHALIAVIDINVGADAEGLTRQLAAIMPNEPVRVRATNESLVLDGTVTNAVAASRVVAIAETFAPGKIINMMSLGSPQQVLLEVRFSEMKRNTVEQLGIRTVGVSNAFNNGTPKTSVGTGGTNAPAQNFGTIAGSFGIGGFNLNLALDALEQKGLATTLAEPNLIALSGQTASFLAGGEFPIPVVSGGGSGTANGAAAITIQFKQFGVSLAFTPTVLEDGIINLAVAPEVSAIDPAASITLNNIVIPGLRTRRASTSVELRDGQSFAIAGLIQSDFAVTASQIPLLGKIPILGALFRSSSFQRGETELVIIVTPHLVHPVPQGTLRVPTDRVTSPEAADLILHGKTEGHHALPPLPEPSR